MQWPGLTGDIPEIEYLSAFQPGSDDTGNDIPFTHLCSCHPDKHSTSTRVTWSKDLARLNNATGQAALAPLSPAGGYSFQQPQNNLWRPSPCRRTAASGLGEEPCVLPCKTLQERRLYIILSECPDPAAWSTLALAARVQAGRPCAAFKGQPMHECPRTCPRRRHCIFTVSTAHRNSHRLLTRVGTGADAFAKHRTHTLCSQLQGKNRTGNLILPS